MSTETNELWNYLQRRDMNGAALHLVSEHADEVLSLCRAMVRDEVVAEDLSQDVFGRAFAALASFRGEASSRTWILRIARNRCIDHLRLAERSLADDGASTDEAPTPEPRIDDLLAARGQVRIGLDALEENERALVMLRFGHDLAYGELAATFGVSEGSARMRVSRAVAKMRRALQPPAALRSRAQAAPPSLGSPPPPPGAAPSPSSQGSGGAAPPPRSPTARRAPAAPQAPRAAPQTTMAAPSASLSAFASAASHQLRARLQALAAAV